MRTIQTLIFDKEYFDRKMALAWAKKHGFRSYTSRITPQTIRVRQIPVEKIKRIGGTFTISKGIKALYVEV